MNLVHTITSVAWLMKANFSTALILVGALWVIQAFNYILNYRLNRFGIYPRRASGLFGIIFSPCLHGDFNHLFFNSIPLVILIDFCLLNGMPMFISITVVIVCISGSLTWLFGRRAFHVGASGLIMGYIGYLLVGAYQHPSVKAIVLGSICLYYFGSFLFQLFPTEKRISWEGHLFGFLAGVSSVYLTSYVT